MKSLCFLVLLLLALYSPVSFAQQDEQDEASSSAASACSADRRRLTSELEVAQAALESATAKLSTLEDQIEEERTKCEASHSESVRSHKSALESLQDQLASSESQAETAKGEISRLVIDIKDRQAVLDREIAARKHAEKQLVEQSSLSKQLNDKDKEAAHQVEGLQEQVKSLQEQVASLKETLANAEQAYMPVWSIPYYDAAAAKYQIGVAAASKYHREEIATGRAYAQSRQAALNAYSKAKAVVEPHAMRAAAAVAPATSALESKTREVMAAVRAELGKEKYLPVMRPLAQASVKLAEMWGQAKEQALDAWNSDTAKSFSQQLRAMLTRAEDDLSRIYTHLLGADVPGSGIDMDFVQFLAQWTLCAGPVLLVLPILCSCKRTRDTTVDETVSVAKKKVHSGDGKRSKRRG